MSARPTVIVEPGRLPWTVDTVEAAILKDYRRWGLFQHADGVVRVGTAAPADNERVRRPTGAAILRRATVPMLRDVFGRAIDFRRPNLGPTDCPAAVAGVYLARAGSWRLPVLRGVVSAPVVRPDGTILAQAGFDEATGLLLNSDTQWMLPPVLSTEEVGAAVRTLLEPFAEFPLDDAGRSVVISAILTGLQRRLLHSAPMHAFDAPAQGSGKSLLADCVSIIVTGLPVASVSVNADEEELRKKLTAVLLAGDAVVNLDNVTKPLRSDALASILTQPLYQDRPLGVTAVLRLLTNILFLATGNNLEFSGDMPSRVVVARLEPEIERPEERAFQITNLREHILKRRAELIQAALTILQAHFLAGRPGENLKPFGRFEQWSTEIRAALVWAGLKDPCATRETVIANDPERDASLGLLAAWHRAVGDGAVTLSHVIQIGEGDAELKAALLEVAADVQQPGRASPRRLGAWCRSRKGRVIGGFKFCGGGNAHDHVRTYKVASIGSKPIEAEKELSL